MEIQAAVAKVGKYASIESGDTLEMIERPMGGFSLVLADGQQSGKGAKALSNLVVSKAISLLSEGVRDGAAARATHDYLYTQRKGRVSATLNIVSVDMETKTLVLSRNNHCPTLIQMDADEQLILDEAAPPIGLHRGTRPQIREFPLRAGMLALIYTDGIHAAGVRRHLSFDVPALLARDYPAAMASPQPAQHIVELVMAEALTLDEQRPADDMSLLALAILGREAGEIRRMSVSVPVPPLYRP